MSSPADTATHPAPVSYWDRLSLISKPNRKRIRNALRLTDLQVAALFAAAFWKLIPLAFILCFTIVMTVSYLVATMLDEFLPVDSEEVN